jgi:hypothetical protein
MLELAAGIVKNRKYLPIFPDLYDDLRFSEIEPQSVEFHIDEKVKKHISINFNFERGSCVLFEDPLLHVEETRHEVLKEIKSLEFREPPKYIINLPFKDIKCAHILSSKNQQSNNFSKFECTILFQMSVPAETLKLYGPYFTSS